MKKIWKGAYKNRGYKTIRDLRREGGRRQQRKRDRKVCLRMPKRTHSENSEDKKFENHGLRESAAETHEPERELINGQQDKKLHREKESAFREKLGMENQSNKKMVEPRETLKKTHTKKNQPNGLKRGRGGGKGSNWGYALDRYSQK